MSNHSDVVVVTAGTVQSSIQSLQPTSNTQFFTGWMPFLLLNQQCQSTEGISISLI